MVSTWWLLATFVAGGYAGFLLFAMLNVVREAAEDAQPHLMSERRPHARAATK